MYIVYTCFELKMSIKLIYKLLITISFVWGEINGKKERGIKSQKSALNNNHILWNFGIVPVQIDNTFPNSGNYPLKFQNFQNFIKMPISTCTGTTRTIDSKEYYRCAMAKIQSQTCLKFYEFPQNSNVYLWEEPYIIIKNAGGACSSTNFTFHPQTGMDRSYHYQWIVADQDLNNCDYPDMIHQLGHAIGLSNEEKGPTRDKCINIDWEKLKFSNVSEDQIAYDFELDDPSDTVDITLPYNFESIMHHGSNRYNLSQVISPKTPVELKRNGCYYTGDPGKMGYWDKSQRFDENSRNHIRKAAKLSRTDIQRVNEMYKVECHKRRLNQHLQFMLKLTLNGAQEVNPPKSQCFS